MQDKSNRKDAYTLSTFDALLKTNRHSIKDTQIQIDKSAMPSIIDSVLKKSNLNRNNSATVVGNIILATLISPLFSYTKDLPSNTVSCIVTKSLPSADN